MLQESESESVKIHVFNKALDQAVGEIQGWIDLLEKKHKMLTQDKNYSNQAEADREHGNTIRLLEVIKSNINKMKI
jgi:hypothetical protein